MIAFGASLNCWTTRHGALIGAGRDGHPGRPRRGGDRRAPAGRRRRRRRRRARRPRRCSTPASGTRAPRRRARRARSPRGAGATSRTRTRRDWLDPRTLSIALDDAAARASAPSSSTPARSWATRRCTCACPTRPASSSRRPSSASGSASANAIGAAIARPDRLTVAALGDGGALMALPDLETLGRLRLPMLVVVYDDAAYGAEVHHFRPHGHPGRARAVPADRLRRAGRGRRLPRRHRPRRSTISTRSATGSRDRDRPLRAGRQSRPRHLCRMA